MRDGVFARPQAAIEPERFVAEGEMQRHDAGVGGMQRHRHLDIDAAVAVVMLARRHMLDAGIVEPLQRNRAVEPERGERDVPVPAEMALRLA